jgi:hypothetical protein
MENGENFYDVGCKRIERAVRPRTVGEIAEGSEGL